MNKEDKGGRASRELRTRRRQGEAVTKSAKEQGVVGRSTGRQRRVEVMQCRNMSQIKREDPVSALRRRCHRRRRRFY